MKNIFIKDIDSLIPGFNAKEHGIKKVSFML